MVTGLIAALTVGTTIIFQDGGFGLTFLPIVFAALGGYVIIRTYSK